MKIKKKESKQLSMGWSQAGPPSHPLVLSEHHHPATSHFATKQAPSRRPPSITILPLTGRIYHKPSKVASKCIAWTMNCFHLTSQFQKENHATDTDTLFLLTQRDFKSFYRLLSSKWLLPDAWCKTEYRVFSGLWSEWVDKNWHVMTTSSLHALITVYIQLL